MCRAYVRTSIDMSALQQDQPSGATSSSAVAAVGAEPSAQLLVDVSQRPAPQARGLSEPEAEALRHLQGSPALAAALFDPNHHATVMSLLAIRLKQAAASKTAGQSRRAFSRTAGGAISAFRLAAPARPRAEVEAPKDNAATSHATAAAETEASRALLDKLTVFYGKHAPQKLLERGGETVREIARYYSSPGRAHELRQKLQSTYGHTLESMESTGSLDPESAAEEAAMMRDELLSEAAARAAAEAARAAAEAESRSLKRQLAKSRVAPLLTPLHEVKIIASLAAGTKARSDGLLQASEVALVARLAVETAALKNGGEEGRLGDTSAAREQSSRQALQSAAISDGDGGGDGGAASSDVDDPGRLPLVQHPDICSTCRNRWRCVHGCGHKVAWRCAEQCCASL